MAMLFDPLPRTIFQVDLLEPVSHFLDAAHENLSQEHFVASDVHKATNFYCAPLQVMYFKTIFSYSHVDTYLLMC